MGEEQHQGLIPGLPDDIAMHYLIKIPHRYLSDMRSACRDWKDLISSPSFYYHWKIARAAESLLCLVQSLPIEKPEPNHETEPSNSSKDKNSTTGPSYGLTLYNPTAGTCHRHPATSTFPLFAQCVAVSDKLIVLGGWDPATLDSISDVQVIDIVTGACRRRSTEDVPEEGGSGKRDGCCGRWERGLLREMGTVAGEGRMGMGMGFLQF